MEKFLTAVNSYMAMRKVEVSWRDMVGALPEMEKYGLDFVGDLTLR